jgi:tRNA (guanine37-N1)-methyltransferase
MHFHVITLFPDVIDSYVNESILGRAVKSKKIKVSFYNPRDFTKDLPDGKAGKKKRIDQRPYGGGPGMVIEAESVLMAIEKARGKKKKAKIFFFSPSGKQFDSKYAELLAKGYKRGYKDIILISGHYEGVDARVRKIVKAESLSTGPYVLTGGEVPAMAVIDAVSRFLPGVLGNEISVEERRISSADSYTRPEILSWKGKKYRVPKVLLSGHHKNIEKWKRSHG